MVLPLLLLAARIVPASPEVKFRQPQLAVGNRIVAVAFGAGDTIYFASSRDGGATFGKPVKVAEPGKLALGSRRGPRIAIAGQAIVISAIAGAKGGGADGDLQAWRSTDGGRSWSPAVRINDVPAAAREGLHAMASDWERMVFAAWLDLRDKGTRLYGSVSTDGGAMWSANRLIYASPDGHICECCHHSVAINAQGHVYVMWRNWLGGARDMYLARSLDGGRNFEGAEKLGEGTWPLDACPMDGGGVAFDERGQPVTAWRRDDTVYLARPGAGETALGKGKDPSVAAGPCGLVAAWKTSQGIVMRAAGSTEPSFLVKDASYVHLASGKRIFAAWEDHGKIVVNSGVPQEARKMR